MADGSQQTHIIAVHGTFAGREHVGDNRLADKEFYSEKSEFAAALRSQVPDAKWHEFTWSGKNLESSRTKAAREFRRYLKRLSVPAQDKLIVLAHSHGGNVALDALRRAPVDNPVELYTVGTPFVWKRNPSIFGLLGLILPGLIFFLAFAFIAAVIDNGYLRYIGYGVPFFELPTGKSVTAFFDQFNATYARPFAIFIVIASALWFLLWPLSRLIINRRFDYTRPAQFKLRRIWRTDDEAIGMLSANAKISFPVSIFNSFFRGMASLLFIAYVALAVREGYQSLMRFRREEDPDLSWGNILLFGSEVIGLGLFIVAGLLLLNILIQLVFRVPLRWLISLPINSVLRKTSIGEDSYQKLSVSSAPNIPEAFIESYNEKTVSIAPVLEDVKARSDKYMLDHRADIMRTLTSGDGYLMEVLGESELAMSLIHCNYFTPDMARFMAGLINDNQKV